MDRDIPKLPDDVVLVPILVILRACRGERTIDQTKLDTLAAVNVAISRATRTKNDVAIGTISLYEPATVKPLATPTPGPDVCLHRCSRKKPTYWVNGTQVTYAEYAQALRRPPTAE